MWTDPTGRADDPDHRGQRICSGYSLFRANSRRLCGPCDGARGDRPRRARSRGFAGLRAHAALAARLDILAGALDAVPEAQLVVAADGRAIFANVAFYRFSDKGEATLEHFKRILATDPQAVACDGDAGGFRWSAAKLSERSGYRLWSLRAISDSNQTEARAPIARTLSAAVRQCAGWHRGGRSVWPVC